MSASKMFLKFRLLLFRSPAQYNIKRLIDLNTNLAIQTILFFIYIGKMLFSIANNKESKFGNEAQ